MVLRMARPYLNGTVWWLRKKVPHDLRAAVGVTEWKRSLQTRDPNEARVRFAKLNAELEEQWAGLRAGEKSLSHKQIVTLSGELCREFIAEHEENPEYTPGHELAFFFSLYADGKRSAADVVGEPSDDQASLIKKLSDDARRNDRMIADFLLRRGMRLNEQTMSRFRKEVITAMRIAREQLYRMQHSNYEKHPELERFPAPLADHLPTQDALSANSSQKEKLSFFVNSWVTSKLQDKEWKNESDAKQHRTWASRFIDLVGDRQPSDYTKADARIFRDALKDIPPLFSTKKDYAGLGFKEAAAKATKLRADVEALRAAGQKLELPPAIAIANRNKILGYLAAFWNWLDAECDHIIRDPFTPLKVRDTDKQKKRTPFRPHELTAIYNAPLYRGCKSDNAWLTAGDHSMRHRGLFWLPLIGLFTGARSNEIIQLQASDLKYSGGIFHFDMAYAEDDEEDGSEVDFYTHEGPKKSFKTLAAIRRVPVHSELMRIGLEEFWALRVSEGGRLFPEMKTSTNDGKFSSAYSRPFRHFLESLKVKRKRNAFHSYRHNFEDACKQNRVERNAMNALQGHKEAGMAGIYGDGDYGLKLLDEELQKVRYESLDLSHLYLK